MSGSKVRNHAVGECKRCLMRRRSRLSAEMICRPCYEKEPKAKCTACGKEKRFVTDGGGVCPECIRRTTPPADIECARCGKKKPPAKRSGEYCKPCQKKVNFGSGICSGCRKDKQYKHKTDRLCYGCAWNRYAPKRLRRYVETVSISSEYNLSLFHRLTGLINWEKVNRHVYKRFRRFGRFLQSHKFEGPLTWEAILKLKADLPGVKLRPVRSCLEQLGDLLIDPAVDETIEMTKKRIRPLVPISQIQGGDVAVFQKYDLWLRTERKDTSTVRRAHFKTLAGFRRWIIRRGLTSIARVETAHVEEYLHTMGLKWRCKCCGSAKTLNTRGETSPTICENLDCRARHSYEKVIRCVESTVRHYRGRLRIFFGWLKDVEHGIETNPAPPLMKNKRKKSARRTGKTILTIQYYDWELIDALLNAIESPDMPTEEAMVLYLVLHHAFSVVELKTVRIPLQCRPTTLGTESREPLENVLSLEWQPRELSRGRQSLGRTGEIFVLEPSDEPWLRDLVRRFVRERNQKLRNPNNPYLFVGIDGSPRTGHVGDEYFRRLVERATARITRRVCTVRTLVKSSRLLYSEFGGLEGFQHLQELGLEKSQARRYAWAKRVRVVPKPAGRTGSRMLSGVDRV